MFKMVVGHSDDLDPGDAAAEALDQCADALDGIKPQASLLFSAFDEDCERMVAAVNQAHPGIQLVGCTTAGEMSSVLGFQEDTVTLCLLALDSVDMTAGVGKDASGDPLAACKEAVAQAKAKTTKDPTLCITTPDHVAAAEGDIVTRLLEILGGGISILGGASGDSGQEIGPTTHQFCCNQVLRDSVPVLLFSGPLDYATGVATGWKPLGKVGRVTKSDGNLVQEIDGQPALRFYQSYLGADATSGDTHMAIPLAVYEEDGGDFYLRAPIAYDEDTGSATFLGSVPEGASVQFSVASPENILEGTEESLTRALSAYPGLSEPEAALVFSCAARKMLLGTRTSKELDLVRSRLGDHVPVCGFYAFGEIAPVGSAEISRFHNETFVTLLLGTK